MKYVAIPEKRYTSVHLSFKRATPKSDYIRILKTCSGKQTSLSEIYPGVKSPIAQEVVALAKQGYLQKYTAKKYTRVHRLIVDNSILAITYSRVWYKTTKKGERLVQFVLLKNK
jgi:hypothetical protein